jgi:hypothetical protein
MAIYTDRQMVQLGYALRTEKARDVPRYEYIKASADGGAVMCKDTATGQVGVYISSMGIGFRPGGYVDGSGVVRYRNPCDDPFQGR